MRLLALLVLVGSAVVHAQPAEPPKPDAKRAKIEELLVLQKTEWQLTQAISALETYIANTRKQSGLPQSPAAAEKEKRDSEAIRERLGWARMKDRYVALYHETYTEPELDALIAFHKTAGGRAQVEKMPKVLEQNLQIPQQVVVRIMPEIQKMVLDTLEKVKP